MASVLSRHIDHVVSVGLAGGVRRGAGDPTALFHQSWTRCIQQHGLDPTRPTPARILPTHLVRDHQQRLDGFLRVARAGMEDLYRRVADLGYMLLLTDADGITVDYIGNPASETQLKAAGLTVGADWNEAHAGTCGVGTCLVEQATITCHQAEHFDATHIALTCTSAPLRAPDGQMLGVLDVSALRSPQARESQHLIGHLAAMTAQTIEDANFLRCFARQPVLRLGTVPGLVEVAGDVMFAFDDDGIVLGANTGARRRFGDATGASMVGRPLVEVLDVGMDEIRGLARSGGAAALAAGAARGFARLHGVVIPPRAASRVAAMAGAQAVDARPARGATKRADVERHPVLDTAPLDRLGGDDPALRALVAHAQRLVDRPLNLLIRGETGSGKEVLARALHGASARAARPFVAVNCAAIPESLIESELFGYTPGSFTGGRSKGMKGLVAQSDGGTLFLDEIGDMPLALQTRLLRVLSESEVRPLGAERPTRLALHVIAATHRDLREAVAAGSFREDLYYRLCGATLALPPLRERQDMPFLIETILADEARTMGRDAWLAPAALARLLAHDWPGNVRELRHALRFALAVGDDGEVTAADLPESLRATPRATAVVATVASDGSDAARERLVHALTASRWRISTAARVLGVCRATLYRQMKHHGIVAPNLR